MDDGYGEGDSRITAPPYSWSWASCWAQTARMGWFDYFARYFVARTAYDAMKRSTVGRPPTPSGIDKARLHILRNMDLEGVRKLLLDGGNPAATTMADEELLEICHLSRSRFPYLTQDERDFSTRWVREHMKSDYDPSQPA